MPMPWHTTTNGFSKLGKWECDFPRVSRQRLNDPILKTQIPTNWLFNFKLNNICYYTFIYILVNFLCRWTITERIYVKVYTVIHYHAIHWYKYFSNGRGIVTIGTYIAITQTFQIKCINHILKKRILLNILFNSWAINSRRNLDLIFFQFFSVCGFPFINIDFQISYILISWKY